MVAEQSIMALTDNTQAARLCKTHYAPTVREVMRSGNWRCARRRLSLAPMAEVPAFGWRFQYQLPGDFIRVVTLNDAETTCPRCPVFEVEGRVLLTNETVVNLVYIYDIANSDANVSDIDPLCARAIATLLASKIAWPVQQSRTLRESLLEEYERVKSEAKTANARDAKEPRQPPESDWLAARRS